MHCTYLVVDVVLVDMVLVKYELKELPHCIHVHRLELAGLAAGLLVIAEGDVAARQHGGERIHLTTTRPWLLYLSPAGLNKS